MSIIEGDQVPLMPFNDVAGKDGADAPAQIPREVPKANAGVIIGLTVTAKLVLNAHCPASGVKI